MKKILVTCALPYANGPLHIGHMFEYIQADIWVRYQKIFNNKVYFISADDSHGTPILLKSNKKNINPELYIKKIFLSHKLILKKFNINLDYYYLSHNLINKKILKNIYNILLKKGYIIKSNNYQYYDIKYKLFLPDRYIKGTCNSCLTKNQNNDICEICRTPITLINPISIISNTIPIKKKTYNYYIKIKLVQKKIYNWLINNNVIKKNNLNKLLEWLNSNLKNWSISRNKPYFGYKIPFTNKYFYVWFDALITYISTFKIFCKLKKINFYEYWNINTKTEFYQFIGKDIIYFHYIFWPSILEIINYRKPTYIFTHGYVNFKGNKMSKSKKYYITANQWLKYYDSDSLRYYYATKISNNNNDINFNLNEFINIINNNIVNKIINLASRTSKIINKYFNNKTCYIYTNKELTYFISYKYKILLLAKKNNLKLIIKIILKLINKANIYINDNKPWLLLKYFNKYKITIHYISSIGINMFKIIMTYLKPIIPLIAKKSEFFLNTKLNYSSLFYILSNHKINKFKKLYIKIKPNNIF